MKRWTDHEQELTEMDNVSIRSRPVSQFGAMKPLSLYGAPLDYVQPAEPSMLPDGNRSSMYAYNRASIQVPANYASNRASVASGFAPPGFIPAPNAYFPTDEQLYDEIRNIVGKADLMTVTKKQVRVELTRVFGIDLTEKKDYIHQCIDTVLQSSMP
jgi:hypothetical protein